jgi:parallel beta-helix repeat protein
MRLNQRNWTVLAVVAALVLVRGNVNDAVAAQKMVTVKAGESIQDAVDSVDGNAIIEVHPGVYHETVVVDFPGTTLRGIIKDGERPILDGKGELNDAVVGSGDDFLIEGFRIINYKGNGVVYSGAKNITFRDLIVRNAGLYGVYPVTSQNVLIERCIVSEISDAGIYVGQCKDSIVRDCEVYENVAGIEIENCTNSIVTNNTAYNNTGGILVFVLPNLPMKVGENCLVTRNRVHYNNHKNFAKPGTAVAGVMPGTGVLVMAADKTTVTKNEVWGNDTTGVIVVSWKSANPNREQTDIEPHSDYTKVFDNELRDNGTKPAMAFTAMGFKGVDLFWDGNGKGNGWRESTSLTIPEILPDMDGNLPTKAAAGQKASAE